jgi:hypothetical protein
MLLYVVALSLIRIGPTAALLALAAALINLGAAAFRSSCLILGSHVAKGHIPFTLPIQTAELKCILKLGIWRYIAPGGLINQGGF